MKHLFFFLRYVTLLIIIFITLLAIVDSYVKVSTSKNVFNSTKSIPSNSVGLLLGTAKYLKNGNVNLYYIYRINATVRLFKRGKIKYILISGDNSNRYYDEPTITKRDLIKRGIPSSKIFLDYAGFRTLDSIIRCKEVFGVKRITIISQKFHNERAIFIAQNKGIKAIGYSAKDVSRRYGLKVKIREKFARVKMIIDLLFNTKAKYLGKKILIK